MSIDPPPAERYATLRAPRQVLFGPGTLGSLGQLVHRLGGSAFVCLDPAFAGGPIEAAVRERIAEAGAALAIYSSGEPDFDVARVEHAVEVASNMTPTCVVGVGGGSTIDLAKLVALRLVWPAPISSYYGEHTVPGPCLPIIAVPTTAGTGSEVTTVAVVTDPDRTLKVGVSSPEIMPTFAVCDPDLLRSCPPRVTAYAGVDALSHAVESATAAVRAEEHSILLEQVFIGRNPISTALAVSAAGRLARHLPGAVADGSSGADRQETLLGSLEAGMAFAQAGTGAAHALQYPIGAMTHTAHGLGVGLLLPYVMAYNLPSCAPELARLSVAVGASEPAAPTIVAARAFIEWTTGLLRTIGFPASLAEIGLGRDDLPTVAHEGLGVTRLMRNNARSMDEAAARRILEAAWVADVGPLLSGGTMA